LTPFGLIAARVVEQSTAAQKLAISPKTPICEERVRSPETPKHDKRAVADETTKHRERPMQGKLPIQSE
jgi:hypothetical protein